MRTKLLFWFILVNFIVVALYSLYQLLEGSFYIENEYLSISFLIVCVSFFIENALYKKKYISTSNLYYVILFCLFTIGIISILS